MSKIRCFLSAALRVTALASLAHGGRTKQKKSEKAALVGVISLLPRFLRDRSSAHCRETHSASHSERKIGRNAYNFSSVGKAFAFAQQQQIRKGRLDRTTVILLRSFGAFATSPNATFPSSFSLISTLSGNSNTSFLTPLLCTLIHGTLKQIHWLAGRKKAP